MVLFLTFSCITVVLQRKPYIFIQFLSVTVKMHKIVFNLNFYTSTVDSLFLMLKPFLKDCFKKLNAKKKNKKNNKLSCLDLNPNIRSKTLSTLHSCSQSFMNSEHVNCYLFLHQ